MLEHCRYVPGDFGAEFVTLSIGPIGGATGLYGATPITASATTRFRLGSLPNCQFLPVRFCATAGTVPVSGGGTLLTRIVRYVKATTSEQIITQDLDITTLVVDQALYMQNMLAGITDAQRTCIPGDSLRINVVSNAAIGTQPVDLWFNVLCKIIKSKGS
jgi:hypothetical protein